MSARGQGIDYAGPGGTVNRDPANGIRYGVISCNSLAPEALDWAGMEYDYGSPHCPKCGNGALTIPCHSEQHGNGVTLIQDTPEAYEEYETEQGACGDYACESCEYLFDGEHAFSDEPLGWSITGETEVINCLDSDAMVVKSPYFTHAAFCSPCVPGACSLDSPLDSEDTAGGEAFVRCYALGHEFFDDDNPCPYPVYSVATGELVPAPEVQS